MTYDRPPGLGERRRGLRGLPARGLRAKPSSAITLLTLRWRCTRLLACASASLSSRRWTFWAAVSARSDESQLTDERCVVLAGSVSCAGAGGVGGVESGSVSGAGRALGVKQRLAGGVADAGADGAAGAAGCSVSRGVATTCSCITCELVGVGHASPADIAGTVADDVADDILEAKWGKAADSDTLARSCARCAWRAMMMSRRVILDRASSVTLRREFLATPNISMSDSCAQFSMRSTSCS